jgi:hypothetical protein
MKKKAILFVMLSVGVMSASGQLTNTPVMSFLARGELKLQAGAAFNYKEYRNSEAKNPGLAWGFVDVLYVTPETYGLNAGIGGIGITELWENHGGDYEEVYPEQLDLRDLFLAYDILQSSNTLTVGRTLFEENPGFCGHSHQGAQLEVKSIPNMTFTASVIERWIHHDTVFFNADGITGWEDVSDVNDSAGDYFFAAELDTCWLDERLTVTPFVCHQEDVMSVYGSTVTAAQPLRDDWKATLTGTGALYVNNVPESIQPDYEDVTSALVHAGVGPAWYGFGVGWFYVSDDRGDINAGIFEAFDPLQEDDLIPFDDRNNCHLYYVDGHCRIGAFSTQVAFGYGKNQALDADSKELDVWLYYNITPHVQLGGYVVWTQYDTDVIDSYNQYGSALSYHF